MTRRRPGLENQANRRFLRLLRSFDPAELDPAKLLDPRGMHGAAWSFIDTQEYDLPIDRPRSLACYLAGQIPEAYLEYVRFGQTLPEMPLFLEYRAHVNAPLELTYTRAYQDMPSFCRDLLEGNGPRVRESRACVESLMVPPPRQRNRY
jgi:hypothetical protein